jgi:hypothetical protein
MMAYRNRETGQYPIGKSELVAAHPNTSLPAAWGQAVLDFLGVDEVFPVPPPASARGSFAREGAPRLTDKGTWEQTWDVEQLGQDQLGELFAAAKAEKLTGLADLRWRKETGGVSLFGAAISTDRESQAMISGALGLVGANPAAVIDWKTASGWVQLDEPTVRAIALAVGSHVQACFSHERQLSEAIAAAADFDALDLVDIAAGWPATLADQDV